MRKASVLAVSLLAFPGCSITVNVESNTSWTGFVNGASVQGRGNMTYELRRDSRCVHFRKESTDGYLTITGDVPTTTTTADYGVVTACSNW